MKSIEQQGKTVDDAIQKALEQLEVSREQVSVEILDEGSRGLFGFMGSKPAKVRVSVRAESTYNAIKEELQAVQKQEPHYQEPLRQAEPRPQQETQDKQDEQEDEQEERAKPQYTEESLQQITTLAKDALHVIMTQLQVEYNVEVKRREDQILLNIHCENENFLIGRRGATLDAIQYLVNRIANKNVQEKIQVVLDTSDYRVNRKQRLQRLALRLSRRVKMTGKPVTVAPMNPHDRRIIHLTLQDDPAVRTLSRGTGFMRRVVISSSRNSGRSRKK
ncbi:single-stranded nucleic acid binding domain [Candidatus Vecturithrix granuli]|uniref:RNA-binding protein KhpB n=1 Tax=Vecturithrix granuli TaxID=1499967 RepID=A0A081C2U3_VECG1|nr:single-stranded nucleic acid binding domain [Candidatus Vecturithrix granuli]